MLRPSHPPQEPSGPNRYGIPPYRPFRNLAPLLYRSRMFVGDVGARLAGGTLPGVLTRRTSYRGEVPATLQPAYKMPAPWLLRRGGS